VEVSLSAGAGMPAFAVAVMIGSTTKQWTLTCTR